MLESVARLASALASEAVPACAERSDNRWRPTPQPEVRMAQTSGQFSTFFVADLFFGVDVLRVQEVLRFQQMTRVPQAPEVIEGLINLRGQIVTAIDMRRRLRLPPRAGRPDADEHGGPHRGRRREFAGRRDRRRAGCGCRHLRAAAGEPRSRGARAHPRRLQAERPAAAGSRYGANGGSRRKRKARSRKICRTSRFPGLSAAASISFTRIPTISAACSMGLEGRTRFASWWGGAPST
jgi:hypothetical protein